jgi:prepilin-type N-terminal cleavage/methylation domain-containing protein
MKNKLRGFTLIEVLVVVAIIGALAAVVVTISKSSKAKAQQVQTLQKMKSLGTAFAAYTTEKNGLMPLESAFGDDNWTDAAKPENQEVWYNALPKLMNAPSVGEIGASKPARFYEDGYPLFIAGAPYPSTEKRANKPLFAVGMNSRLQRKSDDGVVAQSRLAQVINPAKTVVFNGSPKANARAFAARHNQKGCLVFADGHSEVRAASELLTKGGGIITPQTDIVWTLNPDSDPN